MIFNIWVKYMKNNKLRKIIIFLAFIIIIFVGIYIKTGQESKQENIETANPISYDIANIPEYRGNIYVLINNNIPEFSNEDMNIKEDYYSNLEDGRVRNGYYKN